MNSRRDFLRKVSLVTGGAGIWSQLPAAIQKALAIDPKAGSTFYDAEHVVLLMQENRSFDHCFGTLQGVRGFNDPRAISLPNGHPVWLQSNQAGQTYAPFRLNIKDSKATWMSSLPHSWEDQVDARNKGKYDGWLDAKRPGNKEYKDIPMTMGYYTREDIPFYYALADAFTVCDQHFCSSLTGTTANRTFFWSGKIRDKANDTARVRNSDLYYNREANWKTFPERLEENDVSWKVYQNEISLETGLNDEDDGWLSNFTDNNLEWFSQYNVRFHKEHYLFLQKRVKELPSEIQELDEQIKTADQNKRTGLEKKHKQKNEQLVRFRDELNKWKPEYFDQLSSFEKNIHQKAFTTNRNDAAYRQTEIFSYEENGEQRSTRLPKGDILHQFRKDVTDGKLPTVSWLAAPQNFSDHPSAPWYGAWYVSEVLNILTQNPEVWKKTIFILTYDENDGYFDHVPPFVAPKPNDVSSGKVSGGIDTSSEYVTLEEELSRTNLDKEDARESPVGLGYRVPLVIASPWTRGGWVNSEVCDITSTLQFLEKFLFAKTGKQIKETNISDWRRVVTGDLTSVFRTWEGEKVNMPSFVQQQEWVKKIVNAKHKQVPDAYHQLTVQQIAEIQQQKHHRSLLPQQERGTRHSCALPYELYVDGCLSKDKKNFEILFHAANNVFGINAAGAPFNVYAPGNYAVYNNGALKGYEAVRTWAYAVRAGDQLKGEWALQDFEQKNYHLRIYGPNGFFRAFKGDKNDPPVNIQLQYEQGKNNVNQLTGNVVLHIINSAQQDVIVAVEDKAYGKEMRKILVPKTAYRKMEVFHLADSFHWYDLAVKVKGYHAFEKRFAGRVETGKHSYTDPLMGKLV